MASLLLGNNEGNKLFSAEPSDCISPAGVSGGTSVCIILKEPSSVEAVGEEGTYIRRGMFFKGEAGLRRMLFTLLNAL